MYHIEIPKECYDRMEDWVKIISQELFKTIPNVVCTENDDKYLYDFIVFYPQIPKEGTKVEKEAVLNGVRKLFLMKPEDMEKMLEKIENWPNWKKFFPPGCGQKTKNGEERKNCTRCAKIQTCPHSILIKLENMFWNKTWGNNEMVKKVISDHSAATDDQRPLSPYTFIQKLGIKACPYCNLEYAQVATVKREMNGKDKSLRPALDHFFPKSKYPFLALSLYNLIPCCTTCNTGIKGDDEIGSYSTCIHPYDAGIDYHENIRYHLLLASLGAKKIKSQHCAEIKDVCNLDGDWIVYPQLPPHGEQVNGGFERAKANYKYFAIDKRLEQGFSDYISELYQKTIEYPKDYINDLRERGYSAFEAFRLLFANYINPNEFNKRPLSKITHDVFEQLRPEVLEELKKEIKNQP